MVNPLVPGTGPRDVPVDPSFPTDQTSEQERIRLRAYEPWEQAGKPQGRHDEHWAQAEREIRQGGFIQTD